jgi:deazaflavin-dependent oxidoreductase (nitroreductase family)
MGGERGHRLTRIGASLLRVRWFVRAPIWLYRARLGVIFGHRLLMLEHIGRKTGQRRLVVLEVVDHPAPDRHIVVSGFGTCAQWFLNVESNPHVRIHLASHAPVPATARRLDAAAATAALGRYAHAHPRAWAKLRPVLEDTLGTRIDEPGTDIPMIALDVVAPIRAGAAAPSR